MRLRPTDLAAFAEFNAGTTRARMARYLDDNPPTRDDLRDLADEWGDE